MYLLAFETSFGKFSISLFQHGKLQQTYASEKENDQAEQLIPNIEIILARHNISYGDLSYIATGTGPGSFTGVRIGLAAAKGISIACNAKLIGVSSLEASAYKTGGGKIYLNASRAEAFYQEFNSELKPLSDPALIQHTGEFSPLPDSESIGLVAHIKLHEPGSSLQPLYVRKPDAKFKTRKALAADIPQLLEIHSACFPKPWTKQHFADAIENSETILADKLGFINFRIAAGECELKTIAVLPDIQSKGVATYLMQLMLDSAKKSGLEKIFLEVEESNIRAKKLYEKIGFNIFSTRKDYYGHNRNAILMQFIIK